MRVDTPTLLTVLAHEIRGPVSALQGFLRLLEQQPDGAAASQLPDAMRRSLSRLASLGTEASDLATWLKRPPTAPRVVTVAALLDRVGQRSPLARTVEGTATDVGSAEVELVDIGFMARAIAAVANSVARDFDQQPSILDPALTDENVTIRVRPGGVASGGLPAPSSAAPSSTIFDRGGMGLELLLADCVLRTHDATATPGPDGGIVIQIPQRLAR